MSDLVYPHDCLILDACCAINLFATSCAAEIMLGVGQPVAISSYVVERELVRLASPSDLDQPGAEEQLTLRGAVIVSLQTEEEDLFLLLAEQLDDGEAMTAAIAISRNWAIASDDRKVRSVLGRLAPALKVLTTPDMIKHWAEQSEAEASTVGNVIEAIETTARFRPWHSHSLYDWWQSNK